jgi:putative ABC transport system ATP-binding protein
LRLANQGGPTRIKLVGLTCAPGTRQSLTIDIAPGTTAALVGRSGSGKSKVIETIAGLHAPVGGYALINDFRVDLIGAESLQQRIGFINDIEVFEGSVDENLRLGRREIDSGAITDVIEKMGLQKTITNLEDGIKTELKVSGYPLSTGQAVRLVLARALIARPGALLIDGLLDRLADVDLEDVMSRLRKYSGETTIVIATGRQAIGNWADSKMEM